MALARLTDKPVVVVPPHSHPPEHLRTAVVAMKGKPGNTRALQRSIEISSRAGLEIVVVHVHDEDSVPSFSDQVQHETEAYANEFFSRHLIERTPHEIGTAARDPPPRFCRPLSRHQLNSSRSAGTRSGIPRAGAVAKETSSGPITVLCGGYGLSSGKIAVRSPAQAEIIAWGDGLSVCNSARTFSGDLHILSGFDDQRTDARTRVADVGVKLGCRIGVLIDPGT